ncbi:MAG: chromate transporter [Clostridia bacterium]|nr:chromate transporter [Clostridia bacterium]
MRMLTELFWAFLRIGLFTFGGGYAMIPLIERTCVVKKEWITHEEMANITVIAESTPGPVAINCATYVGLKKKGFWGAVAATLGVVLPSFLIILLISFFLDRFLEIRWIASAFKGIRIAVGILIVDAAVRMIVRMKKKPLAIVILSVAFAAMMLIDLFALRISTVVLMLAAAAVGLTVYLIRERAGRRDRNDPS